MATPEGVRILETNRLFLRTFKATDVDDLLEYQSNPEIVRYIPWPERTREQVIAAIEKALTLGKSEITEDGDFIFLAWQLKRVAGLEQFEGKVIGQSNLSLKSQADQCGDIGWVTHQDFHRKGFAYEATRAMMNFGFENFGLHRLVADIDTRNPETAELARKLGMRREAEYKEVEFFKGAWCDMWLYAILKSEFSAQAQ